MRVLELFCLQKRKLRADLINVYKYLKGECKEDEAMLFSAVSSAKTKSCKHTEPQGVLLNTRKYLFLEWLSTETGCPERL